MKRPRRNSQILHLQAEEKEFSVQVSVPEIIGRKEENGKRIGFGRNQKTLVFNMKTMGRESVRGREEEMRMITQDNRIKKRVWRGDFILKS